MSNIVLTLSAQDAAFVQKMVTARAEAMKLGYSVELLDSKGKKAGQSLGNMLGGVATNLGRTAAQFAGVGSAIAAIASAAALIRTEYEQIKQRRSEAAGTHLRLADSEAQLLQALGSQPGSMQLKTATAFLQKAAATHGTDLATVYRAAAGALSGRGSDISELEALQSVSAAAGVSSPTVTETDLLSMASGIQELRKGFGGTAEQQAGMMLAMGAIHRSPDIASMTQHALPVVANVGRQFGMSEQESMTALSVLSNIAGDTEGRMSATQFQQMAEQVFRSTHNVKSLKGKGFDERLQFIAEGTSKEAEMIRTRLFGSLSDKYAGEDRKLRRDMERSKRAGFDIAEFHGEAKTKLAALSFLDVNSPIGGYRKYRESMAAGEIPSTLEGGGVAYEAKRKQLKESEVQQAARMAGSIKAMTEQTQLANPGEAFRGVLIEKLPEMLRAMGQSGVVSKIQGIVRNLRGGASAEEAYQEVDNELKRLLIEKATPGGGFGSIPFERFRRRGAPANEALPALNLDHISDQDKRDAQQIQEMRRQLHDIRQQQVPTGPAPTPAPSSSDQSSRTRVDLRQTLVVTDPYGRSLNRNFQRSHPARALSS